MGFGRWGAGEQGGVWPAASAPGSRSTGLSAQRGARRCSGRSRPPSQRCPGLPHSSLPTPTPTPTPTPLPAKQRPPPFPPPAAPLAARRARPSAPPAAPLRPRCCCAANAPRRRAARAAGQRGQRLPAHSPCRRLAPLPLLPRAAVGAPLPSRALRGAEIAHACRHQELAAGCMQGARGQAAGGSGGAGGGPPAARTLTAQRRHSCSWQSAERRCRRAQRPGHRGSRRVESRPRAVARLGQALEAASMPDCDPQLGQRYGLPICESHGGTGRHIGSGHGAHTQRPQHRTSVRITVKQRLSRCQHAGGPLASCPPCWSTPCARDCLCSAPARPEG